MQNTLSIPLFVLLTLAAGSFAQDAPRELLSDGSSQMGGGHSAENSGGAGKVPAERESSPASDSASALPRQDNRQQPPSGARDKFGYYVTETYLNPSSLTAPAFRATIRMANPPGKGTTQYPAEWRQGAEAFGRNYGDAFAERVSFQTARFVTGAIIREDPRYIPSASHNLFARSLHAFAFTFVGRSDSGHLMPALSNFVGAAAGGFIGNAYLPSGFNDLTRAGQRATLRLGISGAGNLFREFAPQMPGPMRTFLQLARVYQPETQKLLRSRSWRGCERLQAV